MYYKITNGSVTIKSKTILEEINLEIKENDHIAIVGRNGAGKTTLLKALMDNELLDEGIGEEKFTIFKSGKFEIGYLNQNNKINEDKTLLEEILSVYDDLIKIETKIKKLEAKLEIGATEKEIEEYEILLEQYKNNGGYNYKKEYLIALSKFGFSEEEHQKQIKYFSGGEKTKINFLKLLLSKPELLILDEPTNHLDINAIEWLEDYLNKYKKAFLIVSHDRMFLNKTANKIIEISYGKTEEYFGNYDKYEIEKKKRYEIALENYEYQEKEIARLRKIFERFRYKPSKASMAMSKLKQIERMEKLSPPEKENLKTFHIKFDDILPSGKSILSVDNLAIGYNNNILNVCSFEMVKKDRIGIIGENGVGKSTLLKTIIGKIPLIDGNITLGHNVSIGYFDQELNSLDESLTIYEYYSHRFPKLSDFEIRRNLAAFLFNYEDLDKKISVLSGGEKVLLELCGVITLKPNFLILDEPTNHLDIVSKQRLEEILKNYPGTILFVSHDRYFIKEIAASLLEFKSNKVTYYNLTYDEYLTKKNNETKNTIPEKQSKVEKKRVNKSSVNLNGDIKKVEKEITKTETILKELQEKIYTPDIYQDYNKLNEIKKEIEELENKLLLLIEKWERLNTNND